MLIRTLARGVGAAFAASTLGLTPAFAAGNQTSTLPVTASVAQNCTISASAVAFGAYDPVVTNRAAGAALNGTGSLTITCTRSATSITITLGVGGHADGSARRMAGTTNTGSFLSYELYQPSATTPSASCTFPGTTVWNATGGGIFTPNENTWGATSPKTFNVCGTVPQGQDVPVDTYNDSVIATVNF